jgi:hypothetical protein
MITMVAKRIGGFAATTMSRWARSAIAGKAAVVLPPKRPSLIARVRKPFLLGVATTAAGAFLTTPAGRRLRATLARALYDFSDSVRSDVSASSVGSRNPAGSVNNSAGNTSNGPGRLSNKTKRELYEMAKKAGIPGRSTMTKEELEKALKP